MIGTPRSVAPSARAGRAAYSSIQTGATGMQTLDQCLSEMVTGGLVKEESRYKAQNKDAL
jgi:Tfp pilus assembly pilus retraction ATPase PilT